MAFDIGTHTQYDDATSVLNPEILNVAQAINLGKLEAVIWNRLAAPEKAIQQETFRIGQRTKTDLSGTVGTGGGTGWVNGTTTAALPMSASQIKCLTIGTVIKVEDEVVVVKAIDRTGYTIDVFQRGAGGSTAAAHADTTAFTIIGGAINDTDAVNVEAMEEQTTDYENYPQLNYEVIAQTYTDENEARKYFDRNPTIEQEALLRVYKKLAYGVVSGVKVQGTKTIPPMTAGLLQQLSDSTAVSGTRTTLRYNANGAFSEAVLKLALDQVLAKGAPNALYMSLTNAKVLFPTTEKFIFMSPDQAQKAGTDNVKQYEYRNQVFDIVIDAAMPNSRVLAVTEAKIRKGWKTNDILRYVPEPPVSSRVRKYSYQGKHGIIVTGVGYDHIDIYGIV